MPYVIKENIFAYVSSVQPIGQGSQTTFGIVMYKDVVNDQLDLSSYDDVIVRLYDNNGFLFKTYSKKKAFGNDSLFIGNFASGEEGLIQFILDEYDTANIPLGVIMAEVELVITRYVISDIRVTLPKLAISTVSTYVPGSGTMQPYEDKSTSASSNYVIGSTDGAFPSQGRITFKDEDPRNVTEILIHKKDVRGYDNAYLEYVLNDLISQIESGVYLTINSVNRPYEYSIYEIESWEEYNEVSSGVPGMPAYRLIVEYKGHSTASNTLRNYIVNDSVGISLDAYASIGAKGSEGSTGQIGPKGSIGPTGPQGARGGIGPVSTVPGPQGAKGTKGDRGTSIVGATGPKGATGPVGEDGKDGLTGPQGPTGPQGATGVGQQGAPGPDGPKGQKGEPGGTGDTGETGAQGSTGDPTYSGRFKVTTGTNGSGDSVFYVGNGENTSLEFFRGQVYRFDVNHSSMREHFFKFSTTDGGTHNGGTEYTDGVTLNGTYGANGAYIEFVVPLSAPATLYYYCDSTSTPPADHTTEGGTITISDYTTSSLRGSGGPIGPQGPTGLQGPAGSVGDDGPKGEVGPKGDIGPQGSTGPFGPSGPKGEVGQQGPSGDVGPKGQKGDLGSQGQVGQKGEKGFDSSVPGPKGSKGEVGSIGPEGPQGDKGAPSTIVGPQGDIGPQGPQGSKGEPSTVVGPQGDTGRDGITTGRIYYLNTSVAQSPTGYYEVDDQQTTAAQQVTNVTLPANTNGTLVAQFITDAGDLDQYDFIPAGIQRFHMHFTKLNEGDHIQIYVELLGADSTVSTTNSLGTTEIESIGWDTNNTIPVEMDLDFAFPHTTLNTGDRMIVRIYANNPDNQSHAIKFYTEGTADYSYVITTLGAVSIEGPQGDKGDKGDKGADSTVVGPQGAIGPQGPVGLQGTTGAKGDKGEVGSQGLVGSQGAAGTKGEIGVTGPQGDLGAQGTQGVKGQKGELGPTGVGGSEQFLLRLEYDQNEALISGNSTFVAATGYVNPGSGTATVVSETVGTGNSGHYVTVSFNRSRPPVSIFAYALDPKTRTYKVTHFDNDDIAQITYNTGKTAFTYQSTNEGGSGDVGQWAGTNFSANFSSYDMTIPVEQSVVKYGNSYSAPLQNRIDPHVYLIFTF